MLNSQFDAQSLAQELADQLQEQTDSPLDFSQLLACVKGTAAGLWKRSGDYLVQAGFNYCESFPLDVANEFQQATLSVPLEATHLGIVNAFVNQKPVIAVVDSVSSELHGSIGWLERFGSQSSYSIPFENRSGQLAGVFAVSFQQIITEQSPECQFLRELASCLSERKQ